MQIVVIVTAQHGFTTVFVVATGVARDSHSSIFVLDSCPTSVLRVFCLGFAEVCYVRILVTKMQHQTLLPLQFQTLRIESTIF